MGGERSGGDRKKIGNKNRKKIESRSGGRWGGRLGGRSGEIGADRARSGRSGEIGGERGRVGERGRKGEGEGECGANRVEMVPISELRDTCDCENGVGGTIASSQTNVVKSVRAIMGQSSSSWDRPMEGRYRVFG